MGYLDILTGTIGGIQDAKLSRPTEEIINEGKWGRFHKHKFVEVVWERERLGCSVLNFSEFTADFRSHLKCRCGREIIRTIRALY